MMLPKTISDKILTVGPSPDMKGGIAQVLNVYFSEIFESPKFMAETVDGNKIKRVLTSALLTLRLPLKLLIDRNVDVIHFHTASGVSFRRTALYARLVRALGKKVIFHIHGAKFKEYAMSNFDYVHTHLSKAARVVVLSETWKDFFVNQLHLNNVTVIPNIIATPQFEKQTAESTDKIDALFLGQLGERKGIYDLLNAIKANAEALRGRFTLHVGGNGEVEKVEQTIEADNLHDLVKMHGWVAGQNKIDLLNKCRVNILPSYAEGLPISILEAMSYGQAIISTPVGGIPEVVDETNGILVEPGDTLGLGDAILKLTSTPEMAIKLGENSKAKASKHMSDAVSKELIALYTNILETN